MDSLSTDLLKKELDEHLGEGSIASDGEVAYFCPLCISNGKTPDTKGKLYVNFKKQRPGKMRGVFFCFRCESSGALEYLFKRLGMPYFETAPVASQYQNAVRRFHGLPQQHVEEAVVDYTEELQELGCAPVRSGSREFDYLIRRGVSWSDITHYRMLAGQKRYWNRVIVPSFDEKDRITFFVARAIKSMVYDGQEAPKYLNPKGEGRRASIFNLSQVSLDESIIVTEGVFSAIAAGRNAVATFGKLVTETQLGLLRAAARDREVVVCFDGDAHAEGINLAARLSASGAHVSFILLPPDADPASLPEGTVFETFYEKRHLYSPNRLLQLRLEGAIKILPNPLDMEESTAITFARHVSRFRRQGD